MGIGVEGKSRLERNRENRRRIVKVLIAAAIVLSLFFISFVLVYGNVILNRETIYQGVNINGDDLDGLSKEQAQSLLVDRYDEELKNKTLSLTYGDYSRQVRYEEMDIAYDYAEKVDMAYSVGREGNRVERFIEVMGTKKLGKSFELEKVFKEELIGDIVAQVASELNSSSKDAAIRYEAGALQVTPETTGLEVEVEELEKRIVSAIGERNEVEIPVVVDEPAIKASMLRKIGRLIGSYETSFSASQSNRNYNIKLSAESMNERIVMPGEVFSFNESTGPRSTEKGYRVSTVIVNNEFVPGLGGGVCQTSTTLYNAVIGAQLEIVERHPHSKPVGYVPRGRDATVAYNLLDFKFRNNFDSPIFIRTEVGSSFIRVEIYGE